MTLDEARALAEIITNETCEGCHVCMERMAREVALLFPTFYWQFTHENRGANVTVSDRA